MTRLNLIIASMLLLLAGAVGFWWYSGTFLVACEDEIVAEYPSPSGSITAIHFRRNCGATTDYSSIVELNTRQDEPGTNAQSRVLVLEGDCEIGVAWQADQLRLSYPNECEAFTALESWQGVTIAHNPSG